MTVINELIIIMDPHHTNPSTPFFLSFFDAIPKHIRHVIRTWEMDGWMDG